MKPEELLELSSRSEWKKPLQMAWGDAQLRCRDAAWARAMLAFMKKGGAWPTSGGRLDILSLVDMLERKDRERAWEDMLSGETLAGLLEDIRTRQELDYHMSQALADKAVSALKSRLTSAKGRDYALSYVIDELAMVLPLSSLESVRQMFASLPDTLPIGDIPDRFSVVARQRLTMNACFSDRQPL